MPTRQLGRPTSMPNLRLPTFGHGNELSNHVSDSESGHRVQINRLQILQILSDTIYSIHGKTSNLSAHRFAELLDKELPRNVRKQISSIIVINNPNLVEVIENIQKNLFTDESVILIDHTSCMVRFCTKNEVSRIGRRF